MFLAVEIGGSKLQLCAGTGDGKVVERVRFAIERSAGGAGIRATIATSLPPMLAQHRPVAIGVGYGGPVDWRTGRIIKSYHVPGWDDFPLGEWLAAQTGLPCFVENDSNAAAFGEATAGAGRGLSPVFYTNMGSGVGGGLVVEGVLYHGAPPGEMEFGHLRLNPEQTIVEDHCSGWAVDRRIRAALASHPASTLTALAGDAPGGEARHLAAALVQNDPLARQVLEATAGSFAFALSHVVHLLHPAIIILGGGLALIGEPLREAIAAALVRNVMDAFLPPPPVVLAALGEDAVPVGALALAAQRVART